MTTLPLDPYISVSGEFRNPGSPGDRAYAPPPTMRSFAAAIRNEAALLYAPIGSAPVISVNGKTGVVVLNAADVGALTKATADTLYAPVGHNHDAAYLKLSGGSLTGPLTITGNAVAVSPDANNIIVWRANGFYAPPPDLSGYSPIGHNHDAAYLKLTGGNLTGALTITGSAVGRSPDATNILEWRTNGFFVPPTDLSGYAPVGHNHDARYLQLTGGNLTGALTISGSAVGRSPDATNILEWRANGFFVPPTDLSGYSPVGHNHDLLYLKLTGGALTGPLTIQTKPVGVSPDASNAFEWRANGFYAPAGGASGSVTVLRDEDFAPANAATTVTLSQTPTDVHVVTRNGVAQSEVAGHYSIAGAVLTFSTAFVTGERVIVVYSVGTSVVVAADVWTKAESDARFVNVPGDTMTGMLTVSPTTAEEYGVSVLNDRARARFRANTDTTYGRVGHEYAGAGMSISNNLTTTTASGGWARDDTTKLGASLSIGSGSTILNLASVAAGAGANPATLVNRVQILPSGSVSVYPDAGTFAIGVNPSTFPAWRSDLRAISLCQGGAIWGQNNNGALWVSDNHFIDTGGDKAVNSGAGGYMKFGGGELTYYNFVGATAGAAPALRQRFVVTSAGQLTLRPAQATFGIQIREEETTSPVKGTFIGHGLDSRAGDGAFGIFNNGGGGRLRLVNGTGGGVGGDIVFESYGGKVRPDQDAVWNLGDPSFRWLGIYSYYGTLNPCSQTRKQIVAEMDDAQALEQIMALPAIYRFHYLRPREYPGTPPSRVGGNDGKLPYAADGQDGRPLELEPDTSMEFIGPIAEEMPDDMRVSTEHSANVNTEGHLMSALRGAVKEMRVLQARIAALEAKVA